MGVEKEIVSEGNGPAPQVGQKVTTHCTAYLEFPDKPLKKFWSTHDTNEPFSFNIGLKQVIRGWDEGMMTMKLGERAKLHISADYGYGAKGFPSWGIPPNAPLMFDVTIIDIK